MSSTANINGVTITDNCFSDIKGGENPALTGAAAKANNGSASAVGVGWSNANFDITNLLIEANLITNVNACIKDWAEGGKGAYGVIINVGASGSAIGKAIYPVVQYNTISDLEGLWAHGIGLEGETPGASVHNNDIFGLTDHKTPSDAAGVQVEDNVAANSVGIHNNSFTAMSLGVQNVTALLVNATCNWYGTTVPAAVAAKISGPVTYLPWLTSGANLVPPPQPGFNPSVACVSCALALSQTHVDVACPLVASGSINLTVEDGIGPYSYQLDRPWRIYFKC